ncbi:MAG: hypothetical protein CMJ64_18565 [Planctomycetaceae bacterium]|nr:hypothetical protein [Planctomycetaceae bacterium]
MLGQQQWRPGSRAALHVGVYNRSSGQRLPGVPVRIALWNGSTGHSQVLARFDTARGDGAQSFTVPNWRDGEYELHVSSRVGIHRQEIARPLKLRREWKLMLSSDKPVYQVKKPVVRSKEAISPVSQ